MQQTVIFSEGGLHFEDVILSIAEMIRTYRHYLRRIEAKIDEDDYHWTVTAEFDKEWYDFFFAGEKEAEKTIDELNEKLKTLFEKMREGG